MVLCGALHRLHRVVRRHRHHVRRNVDPPLDFVVHEVAAGSDSAAHQQSRNQQAHVFTGTTWNTVLWRLNRAETCEPCGGVAAVVVLRCRRRCCAAASVVVCRCVKRGARRVRRAALRGPRCGCTAPSVEPSSALTAAVLCGPSGASVQGLLWQCVCEAARTAVHCRVSVSCGLRARAVDVRCIHASRVVPRCVQ